MNIVFYISSHGFGHAAREIEVINEIARREPDTRFVMRSNVAKWFVDASLRAHVDLQRVEADTGIVQIDSLTLDEDESARRAAAFYADFQSRVQSEAIVLDRLEPSVVVADIPPLAFVAAWRAGVPSIAIGNFTWDWIYEGYPHFERLAPGVIDRIRAANAHASRALRLPLHGGFATMAHAVKDIPLIARRSMRGREETRRLLAIGDNEMAALASFGGYGLGLKYDEIAHDNDLTVIVTDHETAAASRRGGACFPASTSRQGRLISTSSRELAHHGLRYEDLVAAADVVVTKPGYGIVSECIANGTALLYTSRGRFREHDVFVAEMPRFLRCRHIPQQDLVGGRWRDAVMALLDQSPPSERIPTNGAELAARNILEAAQSV